MRRDEGAGEGMSRRRFVGLMGLLTGGVALGGCNSAPKVAEDNPGETSHQQLQGYKGHMTYRINPVSHDRMSILGFGTMHVPTLGGNPGVVDQTSLDRNIDYAIEHGVNYYNSSPMYGNGEYIKALGRSLRRHDRKKYFVATKMANFDAEDQTRSASERMFRDSLKSLGVDTVDYYLLQNIGVGGQEAFRRRFLDNGVLEFLKSQRRQGTIRQLGFSFLGSPVAFDHAMAMHDAGDVHWEFVQMPLNYLYWRHAKTLDKDFRNLSELYRELGERNIPIIAQDPLAGGKLATVSRPVLTAMNKRRPGDLSSAWGLRFVASLPGVVTVVIGANYIEHLQDNLLTVSPLEMMSGEEFDFLERVAKTVESHSLIPCVNCGRCMPCPYGVDIPSMFTYYNQCVNDDLIVDEGTRDPEYEKLRRAYLVGMDQTVPRLRQADLCIGCDTCEGVCPKSIDIKECMQRLREYAETLRRTGKPLRI